LKVGSGRLLGRPPQEDGGAPRNRRSPRNGTIKESSEALRFGLLFPPALPWNVALQGRRPSEPDLVATPKGARLLSFASLFIGSRQKLSDGQSEKISFFPVRNQVFGPLPGQARPCQRLSPPKKSCFFHRGKSVGWRDRNPVPCALGGLLRQVHPGEVAIPSALRGKHPARQSRQQGVTS